MDSDGTAQQEPTAEETSGPDDSDGAGAQEADNTPIDTEDKSDPDVWVDRSKIDFDPDDGLLTGTAVEGGTTIPGPHEIVDDVDPEESESGSEE